MILFGFLHFLVPAHFAAVCVTHDLVLSLLRKSCDSLCEREIFCSKPGLCGKAGGHVNGESLPHAL